MGITSFSKQLLLPYLGDINTVIELGAQNLFIDHDSPYANTLYEPFGIKYTCIDLNGENNAKKLDLSTQIKLKQYDLVTDFGTSEHVGKNGALSQEAYYTCWLNKFNLCKKGGLIISENPKTGNWPDHGFNYIDTSFYEHLAMHSSLEILELGEHPAMGNSKDGWNVYCVLRKIGHKFPADFNVVPFYTK